MAQVDASFEACLARLHVGATIDECLAAYPDQASQLGPLLQIAQALRALGGPVPARPAVVVQRERELFLQKAAALADPAVVSIDDALDASAQMLASGASMQDCLDAFPEHADQLSQLLETVLSLQRIGAEIPPARNPAQLAASQRRLLDRAAALAQPVDLSVEEAFEASLGLLATGATVEQCLDAFPHHAAELRALLETADEFRPVAQQALPRDEAAVRVAREQLLARAVALASPPALSVEEAFEASTAMLAAGATIEDCLDAFPHHAAELRALLLTVTALRAVAEPVPPRSPATLQAARRAFLAAASQLAPARPTQESPSWWSEAMAALAILFRPVPRWRLGGALVALLLVIALSLTGGVVLAARDALPGDVLYPVRLATDQVRVAVTFDQEERAALLETLEQQRLQEAARVTREGRVVRLEFTGVLADIGEDEDGNVIWTIEGLPDPVFVAANAVVVGEPAVGSKVRIVAWSDGAGNLVATRAAVIGGAPAAQAPLVPVANTETPTPTASFTSTATSTPSPPPATDPPTLAPTATATPSPTHTGTPTATATPTPTATPTETATPTATPSPSVTPTMTPVLPRPVTFEGLIDVQQPEFWVISGRVVYVTGDTVIDESLGTAAVGAKVEVEGWSQWRQPVDDTVLAERITVTDDNLEQGFVRDYIRSIGAGTIVIGATEMRITGRTEIVGEPRVGLVATAQIERRGNEPWEALRIVVDEPEYVYFEGEISFISGSRWVVAGVSLIIDGNTSISGYPAQVGLDAEVVALELEDGVHAVSIEVLAPTPTPTLAPTWTPRPSSTPTPTVPATSTPTLTPTDEATFTPTPTSTNDAIPTPSATSTPTPAEEVTATATATPEGEPSPSPVATEQPATTPVGTVAP